MAESLGAYLARRGREVDRALRRSLSGPAGDPVVKAMRYSVFAGGKRLRPVLCLAAAELCGGRPERVMPAACALELIHTYSLVHDDLPAMDDDDLRRGRPTSHKLFGEGMAILAGDALLTRAFGLMAENARLPGVTAAASARAAEALARAAGAPGMVGGQAADLLAAETGEGKPRMTDANRRLLRSIHRRKTGALMRASLAVGAILSGATAARLRALDEYGESLGLAFQIADDVLDVVGDKTLLGKNGSDRDNGKLTYPALFGLDRSRRMAREAAARARRALRPFGPRARILEELADFVVDRKK